MSERFPGDAGSNPNTDINDLEIEHVRPFVVAMSFATAGKPRTEENWQEHRTEVAGNMARAYAQPDQYELEQARRNKTLTDEQKAEMAEAATEHSANFIRSVGYDPAKAVTISPQTDFSKKLEPVNVDDPAMLEEAPNSKLAPMQPKQSDMIFTRDSEIILGCRPADCPVLTIKGIDRNGRPILALLHVGWQGLNAGYLEQAIEFLVSQEVDKSTLRIHVGASAKKENFPYTNEHDPHGNGNPRFSHEDRKKLFVDVREKDTETGKKYEFAIDMPGFIAHMLIDKRGLEERQVVFDDSDTADPNSGYSSHSRPASGKTDEVETRDLVIASMNEPDAQKALEFMQQLRQRDESINASPAHFLPL